VTASRIPYSDCIHPCQSLRLLAGPQPKIHGFRDNCNAYAALKVASSAQKRPATDSPTPPPTRLQANAAKTLAAAAAAAADGAASAANATDSDDPIQEAKRGGRPRGRGRCGSRVKARAVPLPDRPTPAVARNKGLVEVALEDASERLAKRQKFLGKDGKVVSGVTGLSN
jgi:hypothetical protein